MNPSGPKNSYFTVPSRIPKGAARSLRLLLSTHPGVLTDEFPPGLLALHQLNLLSELFFRARHFFNFPQNLIRRRSLEPISDRLHFTIPDSQKFERPASRVSNNSAHSRSNTRFIDYLK